MCADRHKSSIHGVPLNPAPQGLFDRNEIAAVLLSFSPTILLLLVLLLIFVAKVSSKKKI